MKRRTQLAVVVLAATLLLLTALLALGPGSPTPSGRSAETPESGTPGSRPERRRRTASADESTAPASESVDPAAAPDGGRSEEWSVTVLGPYGDPAMGIRLGAVDPMNPDQMRGAVWTDEDGRALLGPWPGSGRLLVQAAALPAWQLDLTERDSVVRLPRLLPLDVRVVDGDTGRFVDGAVVTLEVGAASLSVARGPLGAHIPASSAFPSGTLDVEFRITPPPGFAPGLHLPLRATSVVSRFANRVVVTAVLRPETQLHVRAFDHDGERAAGAEVTRVAIGSQSVHFAAGAADDDGLIVIRELPYLRGERVAATVSMGELASTIVTALPAPGVTEAVVVELPERVDWNGTVGIGGGAGGAFGGRRGTHVLLTLGGGRIEARAYRRNGSLARDTMVILRGRESARTDEFGSVVFENLPPGTYSLSVREPGFVPLTEEVTLVADESVVVTLTEPSGRAGTVLVVDADGVPVPFARLDIETQVGVPYLLLEGDVQHVGIYTDENGQRPLTGLPDGAVNVKAHYGSRRAEGEFGRSAWLTLRLSEAR